MPDLTICLDILPERGLKRRQLAGGEWNRLDAETLEFHERVRAGYLELARLEPARWVVIGADRPIADVQGEIRDIVDARTSLREHAE